MFKNSHLKLFTLFTIALVGGLTLLLIKCYAADDARKSAPIPDAMLRVAVAVGIQESMLDPNAVGDDGKAVGPLQLWQVYVDDVNQYLKDTRAGYRYSYSDRRDIARSMRMFYLYTEKYGTPKRLAEMRTRLAVVENRLPASYSDIEIKVRMHSKGCSFCFKSKEDEQEDVHRRISKSAAYWSKVQGIMADL